MSIVTVITSHSFNGLDPNGILPDGVLLLPPSPSSSLSLPPGTKKLMKAKTMLTPPTTRNGSCEDVEYGTEELAL